jgi:hypothetical protein
VPPDAESGRAVWRIPGSSKDVPLKRIMVEEGEGRGRGEAEGDGNWDAALRGLHLSVERARDFVNEGAKRGVSGRRAFPFFGHLEPPLWLPLRGEALRGAAIRASLSRVSPLQVQLLVC